MGCTALLLRVGVGLGAGVFAMTAAASAESYYVYADVVDVEPLIERHTVSEPREQCSVAENRYGDGRRSYSYDDDYHNHDGHSRGSHASPVATIIGGMIGGLVGSQFGGGNGKKALAITGAMVGASIANQASRRRHDIVRYAPQHCRTVMQTREVEAISGYRVHYLYQGQEFVKRVDSDPGDRIRVQVQVTPVVTGPDW